MNGLPEAGVGMIYLPGLENLIESQFHLLDLIEIEPQTLWYNKDANCDSFNFSIKQSELLQEYPCNKLFHSVGFPVGGTVLPNSSDFELLNKHAALINPLWISEHLSFNRFVEIGNLINTNFLLPPLQTMEGIEVAVKAINHFASSINRPFAVETGVNYLKKKHNEIPDGRFVTEVATRADCNILLDLHNILANQLNGRQSVDDFVSQLPLERVCEIHLAGGFFHNNYYLDGHSGVSSNELFSILDKLVRKFSHLKALVFEMLPEYVSEVSEKAVSSQLEKMHRVWDVKGRDSGNVARGKMKMSACTEWDPFISVRDWEYTLGKAAIEQPVVPNNLSVDLSKDDGLKIINELIFHFRASMLVSTLQLSTRLLRLSMGPDKFTANLKDFFAISVPEMFAFAAAQKYAVYLDGLELHVPYLNKLIEYELASLKTLADEQARSVEFDFNPFPVFRSLSKSEIPGTQDKKMNFLLNIQPDESNCRMDSFNYDSVFHN